MTFCTKGAGLKGENRAEEMQIVAQERLEMIRKMKQFGLSVSLIAEATDLSLEEVTKL